MTFQALLKPFIIPKIHLLTRKTFKKYILDLDGFLTCEAEKEKVDDLLKGGRKR